MLIDINTVAFCPFISIYRIGLTCIQASENYNNGMENESDGTEKLHDRKTREEKREKHDVTEAALDEE